MIFEEIHNFQQISKEEERSFHERLRSTIHLINMVQSSDSIMKLLSYYPAFKKDKMFPQIKRKIEDSWELIMNNILHQPEEDFLNQIFENLRISQINTKNLN
jgi:hypothetical protein